MAPFDSSRDPAPVVLFAGGGTGGHIAPGLAVAERLAELAPEVRSIFVCSTRPIDARMLAEADAVFFPVPATPPGVRPKAAWRFLRNYRASRARVRSIIRERGVAAVVSMGGFVAAPAVSAAARTGTPVTLVNLDAPPGKANRMMARRCARVLTAVPLPTMPRFAEQVVGMPIRRRALAPGDAATCRRGLGLDPERRTLLVTGASQGATSLNAFVTALVAARPEAFADWQILHLAGRERDEAVRIAYNEAGARATVIPFLDAMGLAWGAADLAVSRAGASSVHEAAANAVPTLFLPYPHHRDMHQKHNAEPFVEAGAAALAIDRIEAAANVEHVGPVLTGLMADDDARAAMRGKLRAAPPPDAAATIAQALLDALTTTAAAPRMDPVSDCPDRAPTAP